MKIALIGATGNIGSRILKEALNRGHIVTAIQRDTSRLKEKNKNLKPVKGDLLDGPSIHENVSGNDLVICSISPEIGKERSFIEAYKNLIKSLDQGSIKRILIVGGAGSLEVSPGVQLIDSPGFNSFPDNLKPSVLAHREVLGLFKKADLDWTYFSPAGTIQAGERTGKFRLGNNSLITDEKGNSAVSYEDYAIAMLDEAEKPKNIRKQMTIGY